MIQQLGDFPVGGLVRFMWNTNAGTGGSITRATNGAIRIYKGNSTTERSSANGITDTEDFDGLTGVHQCQIDLSDNSDAGFYSQGNEYYVVLQGSTIDGQTVNACLAQFSIERRDVAANIAELIVLHQYNTYMVLDGIALVGRDGSLLTSPTIQTGDVKVSIDGGTAANVTTLPTNRDSGVRLELSNLECTGQCIAVTFRDTSNPPQWMPKRIIVLTHGHELARYAFNLNQQFSATAPTASEIRQEIDANSTKLLAIKAKTDNLTFTVANKVDSNTAAIDNDLTAAVKQRRATSGIVIGTVTGSSTSTTLIDASLTHASTDQLKGRLLLFEGNVTAALRDQVTDITAFDPALDRLTFTQLTAVPAVGDRYVVL